MISLPGRTSAFSLGRRPRIESEVTDLPLPDSPTSATVALRGISKETPFTASKVVCLSSRKFTRRLRTLSSVSMSLQLRIERVAQRVGEEAEGGDQHGHERARRGELPPFAEDQLVLRLIEHRSPRNHVDRDAEPEERQDHLGLDERNGIDRELNEHDVAHVREDVDE